MAAKDRQRAQRRRHEETAEWILRLQSGALDSADRQAFEDWLNADPTNRLSFEAAQSLMGHAEAAFEGEPDFARDLQPGVRHLPLKSTLAGLLVILAGGGLFYAMDVSLRLKADAMSGPRETRLLTLADGSTALLNASSAIAYSITPTERKIALLKGEAFFTVAPDKTRPFVVETQGAKTTAVGTAFDIHIGEETAEVTVTEHAVTIDAGAERSPIRIEEGQQTSYKPNGEMGPVKTADINAVLAWKRGELVVDNATLAFVVSELDRHFSGHIFIASKALAERRVSGRFSILNTDAALAFLQRTLGITATHLGPLIVLRES